MAKAKINPQMIRQLRQTGDEAVVLKEEKPFLAEDLESKIEEVNKEDKENNEKIAQLKAQKEVWAKKRIQEIETKIEGLVEERRQQRLKRREEPPQEVQEKKIAEEQKKESLPEVSSKPKRGLFWGKRIKTAQQQAQPETVGKRVSG
jgi:hypothetical protein